MESKSTKKEVKSAFITGLLTILPLGIILFFFIWAFNVLAGFVTPLLTLIGFDSSFFLILLVLFILVLFIFLIGVFVRTRAGEHLFNFLEEVLLRPIPGYNQVKSMLDSFSGKKSAKDYRSVVLVDIYQNGTYMTGFATDKPSKDITTVFLPTGPNPTNGLIYHVHDTYIIPVDVPPQLAFESIIAVGKNSKRLFTPSILNQIKSKRSKTFSSGTKSTKR